jgi:translation initiation factor 2B subunit (eIF-2B alpha/beta/delta family)
MGAAINTTVLRVLNDFHSHDRGGWNQILERYISEEHLVLEKLAQHFTRYFSMKIVGVNPERDTVEMVTLSNSSTMLASLTELFHSPHCPYINLTILESRPLFEGVILAKELLAIKPRNVSIQLITDASTAYFAHHADFILLGADQIDPKTGSVKNKIGSLALAKFTRGKVIVVTSTDKLASIEEEKEEENDPGEVTCQWPVKLEGVRVRNVYFEWIDGKLIDSYITEQGVLSHGELSQIAVEREKMHKIWDILY